MGGRLDGWVRGCVGGWMDEHISITLLCLHVWIHLDLCNYVLILTYNKTLVLLFTSTEMSKLLLCRYV